MRIGFDAKRFFHNHTGLGNYSRTLVTGLAQYYPQNEYYLFNPKPSLQFPLPQTAGLYEVLPQRFLAKKFPALWRSRGVKKDLKELKIDLYHGLSHEIPGGLSRNGIKSIVTVHDLIFERYPHQYGQYEVRMHRYKIQHACKHADGVIAASQQTKKDLVEWYKVPEEKITVCYQSCHPAFGEKASDELKAQIRRAYQLPPNFFLYVGSVIERKNLLGICKAMFAAKDSIQLPLVVVGEGKKYQQEVLHYLREQNMQDRVLFLSGRKDVSSLFNLNQPKNLATLYQMATALIYPSFFEGFGIPVLEGLWSGLPVITSQVSSMPEIGGDAVLYIHPAQHQEMANAMLQLQNNTSLQKQLAQKGWEQAQKFSLLHCTKAVMQVYQNV